MARTIRKSLDMSPGFVPPVIRVNQYDSDFSIVFALYSSFEDFTLEYGTTAEVRGTKRSGTGYSANATINTSNKTVTVSGNNQMTAVSGKNIYEIVLFRNGKQLSSANFILLCEPAALDANTIVDESVINEFTHIEEDVQAAKDAANRAEAAAESVGRPTDQQAQNAVNNWLDEHPEATTTVQDGAITIPKLNDDVLTRLDKRVIYVSEFSGDNDNEVLQNAIDTALSMESCTLIIDKTLNITQTINIVYTNAEVQALTIQGMFKNVRSSGNVFHGDANPTLRNNMVGCINCNVDGVVFNVLSRNDTPELCVRDCIFYNNSSNASDSINGRVWDNSTMTLFYIVGSICNFVNNTVVGFDYFINAPRRRPDDNNKANWTGDFGVIERNTIYTCGHGISIAYQDCTDICGNTFTAMYGCTEYLNVYVAHGITIRNNMFGPFMRTIPITMETGITLTSCNALIYNNHGENSKATYVFFVITSGTAVFVANQWTTTQSGRILYNRDTTKVILEGNNFDTSPLTASSALLINSEDISDIKASIGVLNYKYVETAEDWDTYKDGDAFYFNGLTTSIRTGYVRGFFDSKYNLGKTLGTQTIMWNDGVKSTRVYTYGTFSDWHTES